MIFFQVGGEIRARIHLFDKRSQIMNATQQHLTRTNEKNVNIKRMNDDDEKL